MEFNIRTLLRDGVLVVGSNWIKDENAPDNSPIKGHRYAGKALFVNVSDFFAWGVADGIKLPDDCSEIEKAIIDCNGNIEIGFLLWAARHEGMRPQGAYYKYLPEETWELFNACGKYRKTGFGNPYDIPNAKVWESFQNSKIWEFFEKMVDIKSSP